MSEHYKPHSEATAGVPGGGGGGVVVFAETTAGVASVMYAKLRA